MGLPIIDTAHFPIVRVTFDGHLGPDEVKTHIARVETLFHERGRFLVIAELDRLEVLPAERSSMAKNIDELTEQGAFIAEFIVVSSTIKRGIFTAYAWLRSVKKHPMKIFTSYNDAFAAAKAVIGASSPAQLSL